MASDLGPSRPSVWYSIEQVPVSRTLALRRDVLGVPGSEVPLELPGDDAPTTVAFAAVDADGEVLAVARVSLESPSFPVDGVTTATKRLRGMATRPDARNQGIGSAVLGAVIAYVASRGGGLLWCHARIPALALYRRAGFTTHGEQWVDPLYGPHIAMWLRVAPSCGDPPGHSTQSRPPTTQS